MNIWDRRAAQAENERNGIKVRTDQYPGIVFTVRPLCDWNDEYIRASVAGATRPEMTDLLKRLKTPGYVMTDADKALDKSVALETFVRGCVVGWEGVPDRAGNPWPFTVEHAVEFFQHFPDVYMTVREMAANLKNFRPTTEDEAREKVAGNSRRVSRLK